MTTALETAGDALSSPSAMADGWAAVAAIAAIVAALAVIYQSVQTSRSAKASEAAAKAAARGLDVANEALDVARAEERNSHALVVEAHRARMDAALPGITVTAREAHMPLYICRNPNVEPWEALLPDRELSLPGAGGWRLGVASWIDLHNGSTQVVELDVRCTPFDAQFDGVPQPGPATTRRVRLLPDSSESVGFLTWASVTDWIESGAPLANYNEWDQRSPASVSYNPPADSAAIVGWHQVMEGTPLEPIPGKTAAYRQASASRPIFHVPWENREYYLSKRGNLPLPPPDIR